jgi:CheY-specific phosphatase CheX
MRREQLLTEEIHEAAERLWQSMFEESLEYLSEEGETEDQRFLTGCIQVTGAWEGAVVLRASFAFARVVAGLMLGLEEAADEEVCDAMGELTNLTSGALQALLPAPSELTPPSVIEGKDYKLILPGHSVVNETHCRFRNEPLTIMLFECCSEEQSTIEESVDAAS